MSMLNGCPRCGAELLIDLLRGEAQLWCPHCGYFGSQGSTTRLPKESVFGPQQRSEEEAWRKEVLMGKGRTGS